MATQSSQQIAAFAALSVGAAGLVALLSRTHPEFFHPYFGRIPPLAAIVIAIVVGAVCLSVLYAHGWFYVINPTVTLRGIALSAALVALFAVEVTLLDAVVRFPEDMNVLWPSSLLFYPAIAYVVEIFFHVLPLTLLLLLLDRISVPANGETRIWAGIVIAAMIEPTYQLAFQGSPLSWTHAYLWVRLFVFSLVQLAIFRRFDFVSMLSFRLMYYAYWHVIWGYLRLRVLY